MTETYYNVPAPYYQYIYEDWDASVEQQANILDELIKEYFGADAQDILDVACGIGTQSIGLAHLGYNIQGSDISLGELEYARIESAKRKLHIEYGVGDMGDIYSRYQKKSNVIIACDNAISHLLSES